MSYLEETNSFLANLGAQPGYADLLAIVRDAPRETKPLASVSNIQWHNIITAENLTLKIDQQSALKDRLAGEGADPTTFSVGTMTIRPSIKMPLRAMATGFVDWSFAALWDAALLARWGTATALVGRLTTSATEGSTTLFVDSIADFAAVPVPFALEVLSDAGSEEETETVTVVSVNKATRSLSVSPLAGDHDLSSTTLVARITTASSPEREPAFSLMSLREGMFSPCLVNKITIDADIRNGVSVTVEFAALRLFREKQIEFRQQKSNILKAFSLMPETRLIDPISVKITSEAANSGDFGLAAAIGNPMFAGFQGLDLPRTILTGISITIDNQLQEVYTSHSISTDPKVRQRENSYPFALASQGRTVSGTLKYDSPVDPYVLCERLAGPSSLAGGGLSVDFGDCRIRLSELAWSPASSEGDVSDNQSRELQWTLLSETFDASPILEYSSLP